LDSFKSEERIFRADLFDIYLQDSSKANGNFYESSPVTERKLILQPRLL